MVHDPRPPKLAVLIDAENVSANVARVLFEKIAKLGDAVIRRIYGDFSQTNLKPWSEALAAHAIVPQQQFAYVAGKNASDISLVIDAVDLLHGGRVDGFCIVSSDSDFTRLAYRIREAGLRVYGFGELKAPNSLKQACHQFFDIETLLPVTTKSEPKPQPAKRPLAAAEITQTILRAFKQVEVKGGWADLGEVCRQLRKLEPSLTPRSYGCSGYSDLIRSTGIFEVKGEAGAYHMRLSQRCGGRPISSLQEHSSEELPPPATFPLQ